MLTRDETITAFRSILGRDPFDEEELQFHYREHRSLVELRAFLLSSEELQQNNVRCDGLSPVQAFEIVYGRKPTATELQHLLDGITKVGAKTTLEILRITVTAFDRRDYPDGFDDLDALDSFVAGSERVTVGEGQRASATLRIAGR